MVVQGDNHCYNNVIGDVSYLELDLYNWGCDCWQVQPLGQAGEETEDIDVVFVLVMAVELLLAQVAPLKSIDLLIAICLFRDCIVN